MFVTTFDQIKKQIGQLEQWLDDAASFAAGKKFAPGLFLGFRLAPDQFAFARQVQVACDTAKLAAARLTGIEAPKHADDETSLEDLKARVRSTLGFLDGIPAEAFAES